MWERVIDGQVLTFELAGINNQNFLMRDRETGSVWQQVTGTALFGPLKGRTLGRVFSDELTFQRWRAELPLGVGRVLRPAPDSAWIRFADDWEAKTAQRAVRVRAPLDAALPPRTVILGVHIDRAARAYPIATVVQQWPIIDRVGETPIALVAADAGRSIRAFDLRTPHGTVELMRAATTDTLMLDAKTGSTFDFRGIATSGPLRGTRLASVQLLKDYWFDWKSYNPNTTLYRR